MKAGEKFVEYGCIDVNRGQLIHTEIKGLRENVSSLRGFLQGCQDTINSETAKLEKECLSKIQSLENDRLDLERKCNLINDKNVQLAAVASKYENEVRRLEKIISDSKTTEFQLCANLTFLESQLEAKGKEYSSVRKDLEKNKMKCLQLENKVASNQVYVQEQREVLHEMASDQKQLQTSSTDLQFRVVESKAYEKALEGHLAELEAICSILQEKHDEQQKYFLQKEVIYKREANDKYELLKTEKNNLSSETQDLKVKFKEERSKCDHETTSCRKLEKRNSVLESSLDRLKEKLETTLDDFQVEKTSVGMLTQKNLELSQQLLHYQSEIRHMEEKVGGNSSGDKEFLDRRALAEIGNTVQQYFDGNATLAHKIETSMLVQNRDKLAECEKQLAYERKRRLSAEIQAENLRVELEKAKVESAISRSRGNSLLVIRRSNSPRDYMKIRAASPLFASTPSTRQNAAANNISEIDHEYSTLPSAIANEMQSQNQSQNEFNLSEQEYNNSDVHDANSHTGNRVQASTLPTRRLSNDSNHNLSINGVPMSTRASQKMEEANRKALKLLNGTRN